MRERMHLRAAETARSILAPFTLAFYTHQRVLWRISFVVYLGIQMDTSPTFTINRMSLAWYTKKIWYQLYFQDNIPNPRKNEKQANACE